MIIYINKKQTPWPESARELYRQSERRLLAKLVPTFWDRGVSSSQGGGPLRPYLGFLDRSPGLDAEIKTNCILIYTIEKRRFQRNCVHSLV
jgi:hypothetical protein